MPLDDPFELGILVAGADEEEAGLLPYAPVSRRVDCELLRAARSCAFTFSFASRKSASLRAARCSQSDD
jgi:hypothetical protein